MSPRLKLILVAAAILAGPLTIRAANRAVLGTLPGPGYLPALETRRTREPFDPAWVEDLRRANPRWIFIGDSMLGTRIDPAYLREIWTRDEMVALLMLPASGPSWWYLAFKNWVVPSGARPRAVFIFFRDTNLTDTLFRLESLYGNELDRVAHDREPELDRLVGARRQGAWARLHTAVTRAYEIDIARMWMEPAVRQWFLRARYPKPDDQSTMETRLDRAFNLRRLRRDVASDMGAAEDADFHRDLPSSILPDLVGLARAHQIAICFVRVQRRPVNNRPPDQSPALRRYVADLRQWIEANGGLFHDDTGDPEQTLDLYEDGDHVLNRRRYTEIFRQRLDPRFRSAPPPGAP